MNDNLKVASTCTVSNDKLCIWKPETFCFIHFNVMFRTDIDFSNSTVAFFYVCFIKKVRSS